MNEEKQKPFDRLSLFALILGILALFLWKFLILTPFAGIIVSLLAIKRFNSELNSGKWAGKAGLILSFISVIVFFVNFQMNR